MRLRASFISFILYLYLPFGGKTYLVFLCIAPAASKLLVRFTHIFTADASANAPTDTPADAPANQLLFFGIRS